MVGVGSVDQGVGGALRVGNLSRLDALLEQTVRLPAHASTTPCEKQPGQILTSELGRPAPRAP